MNCINKLEIHFEIDSICRLDCLHCSAVRKADITPINHNVVQRLYDEIQEIPKDVEIYLCLTGGEPLLTHDSFLFLTKFRDLTNLNIGVFTSGCFPRSNGLLRPISRNVARKLRSLNLQFVYVSLYSHLAKEHDFITRVEGSYSATIESIKNMMNEGIDVKINHVLTKPNIRNLNCFAKFCSDLAVSELRVLRLVKHGRADETWPLIGVSKEEQEEAVAKIYKNCNNNIEVTVAGFPELRNCRPFELGAGCQAGKRLFFVDRDGEVFPCACRKNDPNSVLFHLGEFHFPYAESVESSFCLQDVVSSKSKIC